MTETTTPQAGGYFLLPTQPQNVATAPPSPMSARVFLMGMPKVGKTTLASQWAPAKTLLLDLQHGTDLLPGEHYVRHIDNFNQFEQACDLIAAGNHPFQTVVIDTIDLVYKLADQAAAVKRGLVAAGLADWGKGTAEAEGLFRRAVGKLLACRDLGIWFIGHTRKEKTDDDSERFVPELDKRVQLYVTGECEHVLFAEKIGNGTVLRTRASQRYEIGSRLDLPDPLPMDARALYGAMQAGIQKLVAAGPDSEKEQTTTNGSAKP